MKVFTDYREENRKILSGYPDQKVFYREISPYLGVSPKKALREIPPKAFITLLSLWEPPYLNLEPRNLCRGGPFNKLRQVDGILPGYLGIGGTTIPLRCLLFTIAIRKYQEDAEKISGESPEEFLFDASSYDSLNFISPGFSGDIVDKVLDLSDSDILGYRNRMFQRMAEISGLKAEVISTPELVDTEVYRDNLNELLKQREEMEASWRQLVPPKYRSNLLSFFYPPMEVAEALTLSNLYGVGLKFGPEGERGFDKLIFRYLPYMLFCYIPNAVTNNGSRPPYRNIDDIALDMDRESVKLYLESQPEKVLNQFQQIMVDLGYPGEDVIEETLDVFRRVKGDEK